MVISYYGAECFKVQFGDLTLAFNPPSKNSKEKSPRFGADVAFITTSHPDMNGAEQVSFGDKKPFVVSGPGEYELKGITARGFLSETKYGGEKRINTIYKVSIEGMNIVFLGPLSDASLTADVKSEIEDADILFVPIGGGEVMDSGTAYKLEVNLEPSIIIPMHYGDDKSKELAKFLKECGENPAPVEKLTLKKKDIAEKQGSVTILQQL